MKKLLTIALLLLVGLTVSAQGTWSVTHRQADPLLGQEAQDVYVYNVKGLGSLVVWDWSKPSFRLITDQGFFHQVAVAGTGLCVPVNVGFYDNNDKMTTKFQVIMFIENNTGSKFISTGGFYVGGRGNIRKMLSRLKSGDGYIRVVAELYDRQNFDMIVTPYQQ
ncbi:MAG: hypothetical protein IK144_11940 [Bacteroidaceae bacterium]|nr:hypothetical protein [Bacteroidaceae bacterium]